MVRKTPWPRSGRTAATGSCCRPTSPRRSRPGRSWTAWRPRRDGSTSWSITLARELAPQVRVNAIMPGVIETRHHEVFTTPERMAEYRRETPLGRNGTAEEVAETVLFLAADASRFVTGALIDINGGRFLR